MEEEIAVTQEVVTPEPEAPAESSAGRIEPTPPPVAQPQPGEEPYDILKCTVHLSITFLPTDDHPDGRQVIVGVSDHGDVPSIKMTRTGLIGNFPKVINDQLLDWAYSMTSRQAAHEKAEAERVIQEAEAKKRRDEAIAKIKAARKQGTTKTYKPDFGEEPDGEDKGVAEEEPVVAVQTPPKPLAPDFGEEEVFAGAE